MAYRTRLTVSTAIRKTIEGIRTQTQDCNHFRVHVKRCAANLVQFFRETGARADSYKLASMCEEFLRDSVLTEIQAYFQNLQHRLDAFKADDTKILGTKEIKLAEDLIRTSEERGRVLGEFLDKLNTELISIIYLQFTKGRDLDDVDQFIKVAEVIEQAKIELLTL